MWFFFITEDRNIAFFNKYATYIQLSICVLVYLVYGIYRSPHLEICIQMWPRYSIPRTNIAICSDYRFRFEILLYIDEKSNKLKTKCGILIWKFVHCFHGQFGVRNPPWEFSRNPPILGKFWLPNMGDLQIWRVHSFYVYTICNKIHDWILMFLYTLKQKYGMILMLFQ